MAKKLVTKVGAGAIGDIWREARKAHDELAQERAALVEDPDPNWPREGVKPGMWDGAPHNRMPPGCPVAVVGRDYDGKVWCRNARGDLRGIDGKSWNQATVTDLFAPQINYAFWAWPALGKVDVEEKDPETGGMRVVQYLKVKRVERDKLFTCLSNEASKLALFDPEKQHRGRGGWVDHDGQFIWHSGTSLYRVIKNELVATSPGFYDGYLYTRQPHTIDPWFGPVAQEESPAQRILDDLCTWNWERKYLDPLLILGWIASALAGAANEARPIIFTTGGAGVGKSTLQQMIQHILEGVVMASANTTAAGIYQRMRQDSLPVMVDEIESKPGNDRAEAVIELARVAYSGGSLDRGGQDHHGVSFTMKSSFFFSAINRPYMGEQDKTRMAVLNLSPFDMQAAIGRHSNVRNVNDGRMLLRQIMDGWQEMTGVLRQRWWDVLHGQKLSSRAIDTYGTLLAFAELLVGEAGLKRCGLPMDDLDHLGEMLGAATAADRDDIVDEWHKLTNHLLGSVIEQWKDGKKPTVGGVMEQVAAGLLSDIDARERLALVNLGCRRKGALGQASEGPYLAIPSDGPQLARLFAGGAFHKGVWFSTLKQAPAHIVVRERQHTMVKIDGRPMRCVLLNMAAFVKHASGGTMTAGSEAVKEPAVTQDEMDGF